MLNCDTWDVYMNKEIMLTIIVLSSTSILIVGILYVYTINEIQRLDGEITKTKINDVLAVLSRFGLRLQYVTGIIELTAQSLTMMSPPTHANLISEQLKGIPEDVESEKRDEARKILDKKFDLDYVFYAMPNGDIYFLEPFSSQVNLSQLNFAFRDWYSGAINTGTTYVSEVYVSANEKHNVIAIAVPMYSDSGQTLNGIFVGALNLGMVQRSLSEMNFGQNEYLLIVDHNNNIVIDSRKSESDTEIRTFPLSFNEQITDDDVSISVEKMDGKDSLIIYKNVSVGTHKWYVVSIQPSADAFAQSIALRNETILLIAIIITIMIISGFFMIRKINANINLSTQLKKLNSVLEQKNKTIEQADIQKEEFSAMVTHELKTPLVPIIGYCKMLKNKMLGELNSEQLESIDTINTNAKRLESLISDIMDVRKLDLDKMRFSIEDVSIDELFEDLNTSYKVLGQKDKDFIVNLPKNGLAIKTDKTRLRQVFDNLISNAIKFTPNQNAKIEIGALEENNKIRFYVKDNGIGIPKDKQSELFKKFYQIDTSERRKAGGTGLGLAISKGIVEKLNGRIWVESDDISGSMFLFEFDHV